MLYSHPIQFEKGKVEIFLNLLVSTKIKSLPFSNREDVHEFTVKVKEIIETVLMAMAASLNIEAKSFSEQVGNRPVIVTRFNFYPPCPTPHLVLGLKEHSDGSAITIVLLDKEVEGLQLSKDDQWYRVPVPAIADSLLINVGEQAEVIPKFSTPSVKLYKIFLNFRLGHR